MNESMTSFTFSPVRSLLVTLGIGEVEQPLFWGVTILLILIVGILSVWLYRTKIGMKSVPSADELRGRLAQVVTMWAMVAIVVLAITILAITGYNAAITKTSDSSREFIETAKYIFAVVVPVVAGWVGTVMAFYFGKENFRAATESVGQIAKQFTSQDKLGQTRAQDIGKAIEDVAPLRLGSGDTTATITLDKLAAKMTAKTPPFERLPILKANGAPLMVVHRSVLNDLLLNRKTTDPAKSAADYKLSDLIQDYPWLIDKSFVTIPTGASAADAKTQMERLKGCADVFVTADGTANSAVIRWITNVDLLQAAEV